ncbi:MAG: UDP-3-O-acyl-N-acetylglucosamine deacetylase, partial [Flavobacteriaceae bacterium]
MIKKGLHQNTISKEVSLEGVGLHTGINVQLTFKPAPEDTGFVFVRDDLKAPNQLKADAQYVVNTDRGTNLESDTLKIYTSEHVLAALVGLDITNCYIHLNAPEPPIMDGSSKYFVEALTKAGISAQSAPREYFEVTEVITYKDPDTGSEVTVIPADTYQVTTMVDFGTKVLGTQNATLENIEDFASKIAPARTFSFLHEIEMLL